MNTNSKTKLNQLIQIMKNGKVSQENMNEILAVVKNRADNLSKIAENQVKEKKTPYNPLISEMTVKPGLEQVVPYEGATIPLKQAFTGVETTTVSGNHGFATVTSVIPNIAYKQEAVLSIFKNFPDDYSNGGGLGTYEIDLIKGNINKKKCRQLMKLVLAIIISENENNISKESIETTLSLLDIPSFFDFVLEDILENLQNFFRKVMLASQPLYLIGADQEWADGIWTSNEMSYGEILCDFHVDVVAEEDKIVLKEKLSFLLFGAYFNFTASVYGSEYNKIHNLKLEAKFIQS